MHHRTDDGNLLKVLLSEVRSVWLHSLEELTDDLRHAVEVSRSEGALHDGGHGPEVEHTRIRLGVHLIDRRHEDIPTARLGQHSGVTLRCARVSLQVVRIVKLRRVDKDTGHAHVVLAHTATDKAQMPRMQCAHRGHQPDASAGLSLLVQELA